MAKVATAKKIKKAEPKKKVGKKNRSILALNKGNPKNFRDWLSAIKEKERKKRKTKYEIGQHGAKKAEQKRLSKLYGFTVSGDTHESEHTVGYETIARGLQEKRGKGKEAEKLENAAPAYQEMYALHRAHIGTGSQGELSALGVNAQGYRDTQRDLFSGEDHRANLFDQVNPNAMGVPALKNQHQSSLSAAVQFNQLGYAHLDEKHFSDDLGQMTIEAGDQQRIKSDEARNIHTNRVSLLVRHALNTTQGQAANNSFGMMVKNMPNLTYATGHDGSGRGSIGASRSEKMEMLLSRWVLMNGRYPDQDPTTGEFKTGVKAKGKGADSPDVFSEEGPETKKLLKEMSDFLDT